jgi:hypothetical protein
MTRTDKHPGKLPESSKPRKNPHAVALGRKGGLASKGKTSPAKAAAARRNGLKGGRPVSHG